MMSLPEFKEKQILFVFLSSGEKISFKNDNIVVKDADGKIRHQSTCYRLFTLIIVGHLTLTSGLIQRAKNFKFSIVLMTYSLRVYETICNGCEGNTLLRSKQYHYNELNIARRIVKNKISVQQQTLKKIRKKSPNITNAISRLEELKNKIDDNIDLYYLLGIEGNAAKIYFSSLYENHNWTARRPRVKHDIINCLLDIGYTILFNFVEALLNLYGFDIYFGVLHKQFYKRKSLVCDIVEPFRPLIDIKIRKMLNLGQINISDFSRQNNRYNLAWKSSSYYIKNLIEPILEYKADIFKYIQSYYRSFMKSKEIENYPFFVIGGDD